MEKDTNPNNKLGGWVFFWWLSRLGIGNRFYILCHSSQLLLMAWKLEKKGEEALGAGGHSPSTHLCWLPLQASSCTSKHTTSVPVTTLPGGNEDPHFIGEGTKDQKCRATQQTFYIVDKHPSKIQTRPFHSHLFKLNTTKDLSRIYMVYLLLHFANEKT